MPLTPRAEELVRAAAVAASDKLAVDIIAFDVSELIAITDAFLLCSGANEPQLRAIVDAVEESLRKLGAKPIRREGEREARWVLLDYGDIVVHIQHAEERLYYSLERLWKDCPVVGLPDEVTAGQSRAAGQAATAGQVEQRESVAASGRGVR